MTMKINFPGGTKVDADYNGFTMKTDQPESAGGENSAPSPFDLFVGALGTCMGFFVLNFCRQRDIPTENITLTQEVTRDPETKVVSELTTEIQLPEDFPTQYQDAVMRAANSCLVKKQMELPIKYSVKTVVMSAA